MGNTEYFAQSCHLSSIPLIVGYVSSREETNFRSALLYASLFAAGILVTIAIVGVVTASMGRLIGDVGRIGNWIVAGVFVVVGLYMLEVIKFEFNGPVVQNPRRDGWGAPGMGLIFGLGLGPCTFAYFAPVLGVVLGMASQNWLFAIALILSFALGHCSIIVGAGSFSEWVKRYLAWSSGKNAGSVIKKTAGILVIWGGLYFMWTGI